MGDGRADEGRDRAAVEAFADRLSGLHDDILLHILSFMPSRYAVQTCVLARRYRDLWKSVPAIRITKDDVNFWEPNDLNRFVMCLLLLRNKLPLDEVELNAFEIYDDKVPVECLEAWVRYCVSCKPRKLFVSNNNDGSSWFPPKGIFTPASKHLTVIELSRVRWDYEYDMDFSGCVKLEYLKLEYSGIYRSKILSPSLKRLSVIACSFDDDERGRIAVPNLISLLMVDCTEMTPVLESMPFLVDAFVRLQHCDDCCKNSYEAGDCGDGSCYGCCGIKKYGKGNCVLLEALSSATKLELTASPEVFIFRRDLAQCPIFSKLKTLLLNEWCLTANHGALICFLQHSPVLKKLILQFDLKHCNLVETGASYNLKKQSLLLKDLTLEVKCAELDDRIRRILKVLCSYGLPVEKIKIKRLPMSFDTQLNNALPSGSFSFEQKTQSHC